MAEVYVDPAAVVRAARDLAAVGGRSVTPIPSGEPWGADEAGAAFALGYVPAASSALSARSSVAVALDRLGAAVVAAVSSTMDVDEAAVRRLSRLP